MIDQDKDVTVACFGKGDIAVEVKSYPTTNYPKITLQNCEKTEIGEKPKKKFKNSPIIAMVFTNKESLDVLIQKLKEARESFG